MPKPLGPIHHPDVMLAVELVRLQLYRGWNLLEVVTPPRPGPAPHRHGPRRGGGGGPLQRVQGRQRRRGPCARGKLGMRGRQGRRRGRRSGRRRRAVVLGLVALHTRQVAEPLATVRAARRLVRHVLVPVVAPQVALRHPAAALGALRRLCNATRGVRQCNATPTTHTTQHEPHALPLSCLSTLVAA